MRIGVLDGSLNSRHERVGRINLANLFVRAGRAHAERPALALGGGRAAELWPARAARCGSGRALRAAFGLAPGDRVALVMSNVPDYVELLLAGWHAGLTMVPANAKLHPRELEYILDHSGARVCFATPGLVEAIAPLEHSVEGLERIVGRQRRVSRLLNGDPVAITEGAPDDVAWLFYTSGTTGRPKGAMLTHRNLLAMTPVLLRRRRPDRAGRRRSSMPRRCRTARASTSCRTRRRPPARSSRRAAASIRPRSSSCCAGIGGRHAVRGTDHGQPAGRASGRADAPTIPA